MRKFLRTLQPSGVGGKENVQQVGSGRTAEPKDTSTDGKPAVSDAETAVVDGSETVPVVVEPLSLYARLIVEDVTSATTASPSENYWEVIAERRRKALKEMIQENHRMHAYVVALEKENLSCKKLLEETTDLVNTLKELIDESDEVLDENDCSASEDSFSSDSHVNKKMKMSSPDDCSSSSDSKC